MSTVRESTKTVNDKIKVCSTAGRLCHCLLVVLSDPQMVCEL